MKIRVMSLNKIERFAKTPFPEKTTLISIGDPDAPEPVLKNKPDHYLHVRFDDTTHDDLRNYLELSDISDEELEAKVRAENDTILFNEEIAAEIAGFVTANIRDTELLICQCHFGQSRSAAVAAAILEAYMKQGKLIFNNKEKYAPNMLVYTKLLEALSYRE